MIRVMSPKRGRERGREREKEGGREGERERESSLGLIIDNRRSVRVFRCSCMLVCLLLFWCFLLCFSLSLCSFLFSV